MSVKMWQENFAAGFLVDDGDHGERKQTEKLEEDTIFHHVQYKKLSNKFSFFLSYFFFKLCVFII